MRTLSHNTRGNAPLCQFAQSVFNRQGRRSGAEFKRIQGGSEALFSIADGCLEPEAARREFGMAIARLLSRRVPLSRYQHLHDASLLRIFTSAQEHSGAAPLLSGPAFSKYLSNMASMLISLGTQPEQFKDRAFCLAAVDLIVQGFRELAGMGLSGSVIAKVGHTRTSAEFNRISTEVDALFKASKETAGIAKTARAMLLGGYFESPQEVFDAYTGYLAEALRRFGPGLETAARLAACRTLTRNFKSVAAAHEHFLACIDGCRRAFGAFPEMVVPAAVLLFSDHGFSDADAVHSNYLLCRKKAGETCAGRYPELVDDLAKWLFTRHFDDAEKGLHAYLRRYGEAARRRLCREKAAAACAGKCPELSGKVARWMFRHGLDDGEKGLRDYLRHQARKKAELASRMAGAKKPQQCRGKAVATHHAPKPVDPLAIQELQSRLEALANAVQAPKASLDDYCLRNKFYSVTPFALALPEVWGGKAISVAPGAPQYPGIVEGLPMPHRARIIRAMNMSASGPCPCHNLHKYLEPEDIPVLDAAVKEKVEHLLLSGKSEYLLGNRAILMEYGELWKDKGQRIIWLAILSANQGKKLLIDDLSGRGFGLLREHYGKRNGWGAESGAANAAILGKLPLAEAPESR